MLNKHEKIIWEGRPNRLRVLLAIIIPIAFVYVPFHMVINPIRTAEVNECRIDDVLVAASRCTQILDWVYYIFLAGLLLVGSLYFLMYFGTRYLITTQRTIARSYIVGRAFVNTYFEDINLAETRAQRGFLDRIIGTGLIFIADNDIIRSRCLFLFISKPMEIYNILLKEVSGFQARAGFIKEK